MTVDTEDSERAARVIAAAARIRLEALAAVSFVPGHPHKRFVRDMLASDLTRLTERQHQHIKRLLWRYRRQLPPHIERPKVNPDDPIVRQLEAADAVA